MTLSISYNTLKKWIIWYQIFKFDETFSPLLSFDYESISIMYFITVVTLFKI